MRSRIAHKARSLLEILLETAHAAGEHAVSMMAAAMAFWLLLTLAPFALLISLAGELLGAAKAGEGLTADALLGLAMGDTAALVSGEGTWPTIAVLIVVVYSASAFFTQFAYALQRIWGGERRGAAWRFARRHVLGFVLVVALAVALFASVVVGIVAVAIVTELGVIAEAAGVETTGVLSLLIGRFGVDLMAATLLFWVAFTMVPERKPKPRDVLPGALVTGFAFAVGQVGLSWYLTETSRVTLAGSMGSLIALLLWVYYTSLISLFGGEFTRIVVERREAGSRTSA